MFFGHDLGLFLPLVHILAVVSAVAGIIGICGQTSVLESLSGRQRGRSQFQIGGNIGLHLKRSLIAWVFWAGDKPF